MMDTDAELGYNEAVIDPALNATHEFVDSYILPIHLPDNDVIVEMPMLRTRVQQRRPIAGMEAVDCVRDQ